MWQRIQTLYFSIAIVLNLIMHTLDLASIKIDGLYNDFTIWGLVSADTGAVIYSSYPLLGLNLFSVLISLIIVFLFKKRQLQIKLAQLNLFIQAGLVAAIFFTVDAAASDLNVQADGAVEYGASTFISLVPLLFIYLGIRAIKKDEALVRAADRIR